jgi:hypothetical protein
MIDSSTYGELNREINHAHDKHGVHSIIYGSDDKALRILMEEVGEVAREMNELELGNRTEVEYMTNLQKELIQVAAMALTWHQKVKMKWRVMVADKL